MEIRNDYFNLYQTIISTSRSKRPNDFLIDETKENKGLICPFCPGNENQTPQELGQISDNGKWKIRWVLNKFPAFKEPFGKNIIIIETNQHEKQLGDFNKNDFIEVLKVYKNIAVDFLHQNYQYPFIFKNHGSQAGASRFHSHSQGAIYKKIPPYIIYLSNINNKNNYCQYCEIINNEQKSERLISKNQHVVAFCPIAPKFNNEVWIFPIEHIVSWKDFNEEVFLDFADIFLKILKIIHQQSWPYNFYFEFGSIEHPLHFNLKILPRLNTWASVEIANQNYIISVTPEVSANFYKTQIENLSL